MPLGWKSFHEGSFFWAACHLIWMDSCLRGDGGILFYSGAFLKLYKIWNYFGNSTCLSPFIFWSGVVIFHTPQFVRWSQGSTTHSPLISCFLSSDPSPKLSKGKSLLKLLVLICLRSSLSVVWGYLYTQFPRFFMNFVKVFENCTFSVMFFLFLYPPFWLRDCWWIVLSLDLFEIVILVICWSE